MLLQDPHGDDRREHLPDRRLGVGECRQDAKDEIDPGHTQGLADVMIDLVDLIGGFVFPDWF